MRWIAGLFSLGLMLLLIAVGGVATAISYYSKDLPDYSYLKDYQPPILTRIYADDGRMMATIAEEQRIFVPISVIPKRVINAFLAAEDQSFYTHGGVDFMGIARAAFTNVQNLGRDKRPVGASTITQQVAKNMLLGNEVSIKRKVREAILAMRLEKTLSKDRILEIYLNEIFLGSRSYGIVAAALNYFNKSLDELSVAEAAYLAALPKAPNNYSPKRDYEAAVARRNWVIGRMEEDNYITKEEAAVAQQEALQTQTRNEAEIVTADYYSEEVRRQLVAQFGEEKVLGGGLAVKTSLNPFLQEIAAKALRDGLINFDRRERGWRGPIAHMRNLHDWQNQLKSVLLPPGGEAWQLAVVFKLKDAEAEIAFADGKGGKIPWREMKWARKELPDNKFGPAIRRPADVVEVGDVIMVEAVKAGEDGKPYPEGSFTLRQVPVVQGAIVVLDPHTGRVFAMNGGFSAKISQFNRATQAFRQPGSSFKPFIYMAALDKGFTPSSLILDAPFEYVQGPGLPLWKPENYSQQFYGATPLRVGIEKSRNVMTVRLANSIGMPAVAEYAKKFGIADDMPDLLSFSLGAKETTVMKLTAAYGMIVNGGKKITTSLIDRVQDRDGKTIWKQDNRACDGCLSDAWLPGTVPPEIPDVRETIEDPRTAYQMVSILEGVVLRGTGARLKAVGVPLAGKTGTTNESKDAWFIGFTPDLVCGVFIGFDDPMPLGSHETGASVSVPIFQDFMTKAMKDKPGIPFRVPPGLRMVRVNAETGGLTTPSDKSAIWEAFIPGTEPQEGVPRPVLDGSVTGAAAEGAAGAFGHGESSPENANDATSAPSPSTLGTGGLY
ncbi:MAG: penicillin-binding protein 1A [Alphaproteobacteria bacterium]|nr:penicillin-binding protein 1A [Alphaproteobacteria bacterium]